jgi:hypothetical protein
MHRCHMYRCPSAVAPVVTGVIDDGPNLDAKYINDMKSFLTVEDETLRCRYHSLKLAPGEPTHTVQPSAAERIPKKGELEKRQGWLQRFQNLNASLLDSLPDDQKPKLPNLAEIIGMPKRQWEAECKHLREQVRELYLRAGIVLSAEL